MKRSAAMLFLVLTYAAAALALPQYTAIFGQDCVLCRANPTGRGMRSLYGSQFFAPTYLSAKPLSSDLLGRIKPNLSESVTIGADLRTIWLSETAIADTVETGLSAPVSTNTGTIAQMEGFLYFELQPFEKFAIHDSHGVADAGGRFEAYGIAEILLPHPRNTRRRIRPFPFLPVLQIPHSTCAMFPPPQIAAPPS